MTAQLSVRELKRHANDLGVQVVRGSCRSELAEQISKKAKTNGGIFLVEPSSLTFEAAIEVEELPRDELILGYVNAHLNMIHDPEELLSKVRSMTAAELVASTKDEIVTRRGDAIAAIDHKDHGVFSRKQAALGAGAKVIASVPSAICIDGEEANAWQTFFQGKRLFIQDHGIIEVKLDDDGCCTIEDFATAVCKLKIGAPGSHLTRFECATIDSHEGGKCLTVNWGS